ncbi:MAG: hypothetical protein L3K26_03000, partial [Candidatus Hydrogenedentes bacterium]|nr:hypothetical protein [Candidatus Hydrogenedentota bacterium]
RGGAKRGSEAGELAGANHQDHYRAKNKYCVGVPGRVIYLPDKHGKSLRTRTRKLSREPAACEGGTLMALPCSSVARVGGNHKYHETLS